MVATVLQRNAAAATALLTSPAALPLLLLLLEPTDADATADDDAAAAAFSPVTELQRFSVTALCSLLQHASARVVARDYVAPLLTNLVCVMLAPNSGEEGHLFGRVDASALQALCSALSRNALPEPPLLEKLVPLSLLQQLCGRAAAEPEADAPALAAVRALAACDPRYAALLSALQSSVQPEGVRRAQHKAAQRALRAEFQAEDLQRRLLDAAASPLWAAARAATSPHCRLALARAALYSRVCVIACPVEPALVKEHRRVAMEGPRIIVSARPDSGLEPFAVSVGLHALTGGAAPELLLFMDGVPDVDADAALQAAFTILSHAANIAFARTVHYDKDAGGAYASLAAAPMLDAQGAFVYSRHAEEETFGLHELPAHDELPPGLGQLTWRFEPAPPGQLPDEHRLMSGFYAALCGVALDELKTHMTWRVCSLAATLAAAPPEVAALARTSLAADSGAPPTPSQLDSCATCPTCCAKRARGLLCGLISCDRPSGHDGAPLKVCSRCRVVAYCCKEHQVSDWKRHKRAECKKAAAAH